MPLFHYTARESGGGRVEGRIEAPSANVVAGQLQDSGLIPVQIREVSAERSAMDQLRSLFKGEKSVKLDDLILFCRQMHTLIRSGVPIIRALKGMAETTHHPVMVRAIQGIVEDLEGGRELSAALANHPKVFPPLFTSIIQVGENSGRLDEAFMQVGQYLGQEKETRERIKSAFRYPILVTVAMAVAIAVITLFVIPAFENVFRSFGENLPLPTRIIIGISDFAVAWWAYLLGGGVLGFFGLKRYIRTEKGRYQWDRFKLRIPLVGSIVLRATLARFGRAFSMGYGAGVPLVQALGFTARAVGNEYVGKKLDEVRIGLEKGDTLTRSAVSARLFTPLVLQMISVGEETGAVDSMLLDVADYYEREVDYELKNLSSVIEPILIVFMGAMVLILALGVFLPMWNLGAIARGG